jgi:hypothetical protein
MLFTLKAKALWLEKSIEERIAYSILFLGSFPHFAALIATNSLVFLLWRVPALTGLMNRFFLMRPAHG